MTNTTGFAFTNSNIAVKAVTASNFDLTAANTTAQDVQINLPAYAKVESVHVHTSAATTATSLTAFTLKVGESSGGTECFGGTDIDAANTYDNDSAPTDTFSTSPKKLYANFAPTGANWNASDMSIPTITIYVHYKIVNGEVRY